MASALSSACGGNVFGLTVSVHGGASRPSGSCIVKCGILSPGASGMVTTFRVGATVNTGRAVPLFRRIGVRIPGMGA